MKTNTCLAIVVVLLVSCLFGGCVGRNQEVTYLSVDELRKMNPVEIQKYLSEEKELGERMKQENLAKKGQQEALRERNPPAPKGSGGFNPVGELFGFRVSIGSQSQGQRVSRRDFFQERFEPRYTRSNCPYPNNPYYAAMRERWCE